MSESDPVPPHPASDAAAASPSAGAAEAAKPVESKAPAAALPPPPKAAEPARPSGGLAATLSVAALILAIAALVLPLVRPGAPSGGNGEAAALGARIASLEGTRTMLGALTERVAALEAAASSGSDTEQRLTGVIALAAELSERMAALEAARDNAAPQAAAPAPSNGRALESEVDALRADTEKLSQALSAQGVQASQRLDALDARLASTSSDLGGRATATEVGELKQRLDALERRDTAVALRQATYALALSSLGAAMRSGGPFTESLETVRALGNPDADLAPLAAHAGTGVATMSALVRGFPAAAQSAESADRKAAEPSLWSRFVASLSWLVTVRRTDGAPADGTAAALAAMKDTLGAQDLDGALAAADGLGAPAREKLAAWLEKARAKQACETALRTLQARAVTALSASVAGLAPGAPARTP